MKYIIDSRYYRGYIRGILNDEGHIGNEKGRTLEVMRTQESNPHLIDITSERLQILNKRYRESQITPFREITEEKYHNLLNCVPPRRMRSGRFFVSEGLWGDLYSFCFTLNGRYYYGERSIGLSDNELNALIKEHADKINYRPALIKGKSYNKGQSWSGTAARYVPYYFGNEQKKQFIMNLCSNAGNAYDDKWKRSELARRLACLRRNHYQYTTFHSHEEDIFEFFEWIRKNDFTLQIHGKLFSFDEQREFIDFHGNVWEYSAAFSYRIYTREMLQHVINQLRTVKRKHTWKD